MSSTTRTLPLAALALLAGSLSWACSSVESKQLVPTDLEGLRAHSASVRIETSGSKKTMGVGRRVITAGDLEGALRESVLASGVFARVAQDGPADFVLRVGIDELVRPEDGLEMEAAVTLRWSLADGSDGDVLWEQALTTQGVADVDETDFLGERRNLAIERAVQAGIAKGLERLAALELP